MEQAKKIVLTGVSRGLGHALLAELDRLGHSVVGCARSTEQIDSLTQRYAERHRFAAVDVADDSAVKEWADSVIEQVGAPDILINNAATINQNAPLWEVSDQEMSQVMQVNVVAVATVIRHFVPAMIEQGQGMVINISSGWGRSVSPDVAPYCASKWAIEGLTKALAMELPSSIGAIPLNPGVINTELLHSCFGDAASSYPDPRTWAKKAAPFILSLHPGQSGESVSVS